MQGETHRRWVYKLDGNIQSQTTHVHPPKEQWSMTVWIARTVLSEGSSKAQSIEFPSESCLAHLITLFMSAVGHVWRDTLNTGIQLSVQT